MAKTYIDWTSCKAINGQFWEFYNMSFNLEQLQQYTNEKWYVNMTMSKRREAGQYWDTHYFTLNDWNPDNNTSDETAKTTPADTKNGDISVDDVPF